jgi:hypothetical protein
MTASEASMKPVKVEPVSPRKMVADFQRSEVAGQRTEKRHGDEEECLCPLHIPIMPRKQEMAAIPCEAVHPIHEVECS